MTERIDNKIKALEAKLAKARAEKAAAEKIVRDGEVEALGLLVGAVCKKEPDWLASMRAKAGLYLSGRVRDKALAGLSRLATAPAGPKSGV